MPQVCDAIKLYRAERVKRGLPAIAPQASSRAMYGLWGEDINEDAVVTLSDLYYGNGRKRPRREYFPEDMI